jgi:hypothetical protein
MPVVRRLEWWKRWAPVVAVTIGGVGVLTAAVFLVQVTLALLLLRDAFAPASARPPAGAAEQAPADWSPGEPAAQHQGPADPMAGQAFASETSPAPEAGQPDGAEDATPSAIEQRVFRSRRALETIDPRELMRQAQE